MRRKDDLEKSIRDSYKLIHEYEDILYLSPDPKEKSRARRAIEEQWEFVKSYLAEYIPLCQRLSFSMPQDVMEIATVAGINLSASSDSVARTEATRVTQNFHITSEGGAVVVGDVTTGGNFTGRDSTSGLPTEDT